MTPFDRARTIVEAWDDELAVELPEGALPVRRPHAPRTRHRRDAWRLRGAHRGCSTGTGSTAPSSSASTSPTASPRSRAPNDRTLAHAERVGRPARPVRPARPRRAAARGGAALPRPRRPRDQAPSPSAGLRARRRAPRARSSSSPSSGRVPILIHGGRGLPPIAEQPRGARPPQRGRPADRRARRDRGHGGARRSAGRDPRRLLRHVGVERASTSSISTARSPPEQVVYASDYPYGRQPNSLLVSIRTAKLAGFDDKQLRG